MRKANKNGLSIQKILKGSLFLLSVYVVLLLGTIFLGSTLKTSVSSMLKTTVERFATAVFTSQSSTLGYTMDSDDTTLTGSMLSKALYSPAMQYVQAAGTISVASTYDDKLLIHTNTSVVENTTPSDSITEEPLNASSVHDIEENASLDVYDNVFFEDEYDAETAYATQVLSVGEKSTLIANNKLIQNLLKNYDRSYLLENFYRVNTASGIDTSVWNVKKLLTQDLSIKKDNSEPQILIFHTHAHEAFADSRSGMREDTIVGVGDDLTDILENEYGYNVMHYAKQYNFNTAYSEALVDLEKILKENPSILMVIDLHRDGVSEKCKIKTVCTVNNTTSAQIMFFNGVSYNKNGPISYLKNDNLQTNLALSLQMKLYAMQTFPELTKKNFIKNYRFNMHLRGRYSLVEVGDNNNTVEEAKAAMPPLANIIDHVLSTPNEY